MPHSVHLKAPPPTRGLSLTAAPSHHRAALSPATPPSVSAKQAPVPDRAVLKADWAIRGACRRFCNPLLARLLSDENYALILDLLDWKKLLGVQQRLMAKLFSARSGIDGELFRYPS